MLPTVRHSAPKSSPDAGSVHALTVCPTSITSRAPAATLAATSRTIEFERTVVESAPHVRHDAERAVIRTAALHVDESAQMRERAGDAVGRAAEGFEQRPVVREIDAIGEIRLPRRELIAELGEFARSEDGVDVRRERLHSRSVLFGEAAHHDQPRRWGGVFEGLEMVHAPVCAALGIVAHRARVNDDDVGFFGFDGDAVAGGGRAVGNVLGVGLVHLAAEGFDVNPGMRRRDFSEDAAASGRVPRGRSPKSPVVQTIEHSAGGEGMLRPATVAVVGRPNVGKSALFNRLIGRRLAIVEDTPGVTRDRLYALCEWRGRVFSIVDTAGIDPDASGSSGGFAETTRRQAEAAAAEADVVLFVVDAQTGLHPLDEDVAAILRRKRRPMVLAANKAESPSAASAVHAEFAKLGFGGAIAVSALHGEGTGDLLDRVVELLPAAPDAPSIDGELALAIIGRPNVGKSSLLNALLGEERALVSEGPARRATPPIRCSFAASGRCD